MKKFENLINKRYVMYNVMVFYFTKDISYVINCFISFCYSKKND